MSIVVESVTKLYGAQKALDAVSFRIEAGVVAGFLGPNGAGKSTMMKILSCFIPQTGGEAIVCGHNVVTEPMQVRKNLGYLPEHNPLYPEMFVREYLMFVAGIHKIRGKKARSRVEEMIEMTGLSVEQHKLIGQLSKGYRQRVGLAQAMIHDPEVLILDEPTSGLDPNQIIEIRKLISDLGEKKTVMLSTHIMQEVEAICDQVIIKNKGTIVADDRTTNLHQVKMPHTLIIVEFDKEIGMEELSKIPGVLDVSRRKGLVYEVKAKSSTDVRPALFKWAVEKNLTILSLSGEERSLEDVFQVLTKNK
ncbi:MAG: gliding motility-associated ABC transporter ATP-binding subunit GldA [Bacteroidetes bacterium]|nr:gliding motility-associated ABC transporter ATP-binding subunit GldA [Bacteroidota bacterium]